jgi:hypothetical protein
MLAIGFAAWLTSADILSRLYNQRCVLRVTLQSNYDRSSHTSAAVSRHLLLENPVSDCFVAPNSVGSLAMFLAMRRIPFMQIKRAPATGGRGGRSVCGGSRIPPMTAYAQQQDGLSLSLA